MAGTVYHKLLRVSALIVTLVLLFDGGFVIPLTKQFSDDTVQYLANTTGVFASVPENELNAVTGRLSEWERELEAREARVSEREIAARDFGEEPDYSIFILSAILFILTTLIVLNYALDWRRMERITYERQTA